VHGTWLSDILPFVEQDAAYKVMTAAANGSAAETAARQIGAIAVFLCPMDPTSGTMDEYMAALGVPASILPYKGDGYNVQNLGSTSYYGNSMVMRINNQPPSITNAMPDGTSNCIIIGERYQSCGDPINDFASFSVWAGTTAFPDVDPLDTPIYASKYARSLGVSSGLWNDPNQPTSGARLPGSWAGNAGAFNLSSGSIPFQVRPAKTSCDISILQTAHIGGMIVGMGDGSARTVNGSISVPTWIAANDPRDGAVLASDW
jgi:hypothetical protein